MVATQCGHRPRYEACFVVYAKAILFVHRIPVLCRNGYAMKMKILHSVIQLIV